MHPATRFCPRIKSIHPRVDSINPTAGSINPRVDSINPTVGSINPTAGSIDPRADSINPTAGSTHPRADSINPTAGGVHKAQRSGFQRSDRINARVALCENRQTCVGFPRALFTFRQACMEFPHALASRNHAVEPMMLPALSRENSIGIPGRTAEWGTAEWVFILLSSILLSVAFQPGRFTRRWSHLCLGFWGIPWSLGT